MNTLTPEMIDAYRQAFSPTPWVVAMAVTGLLPTIVVILVLLWVIDCGWTEKQWKRWTNWIAR